ncbi:bifunctional tRNA (5-methylaminomethyl-2-thiouridine)(34)-methyltransferase MnmD/FAD-dependent 5-carboxymethylaminomethyl-2-thiouridine(34) oxidoreductase MnmC [Neptuniibacter sp.]|uniref:bifunctional tRNA (5-methylaminomethyl-2-thiouridine)(34)-methyltransferase MnmD/FAD-dependent 5-carboxymethylaminomethyl-2-thiouridine(34) oxidoreductase MnmC n=1 Tax=Neptuniibacter sp. TaxID=1962643 RepID=UPI003B5B3E02
MKKLTRSSLAADLKWDNQTPYSTEFNDIYYNPEQGIEESIYVFLEANRISRKVTIHSKNLTVAETGFGTGLNFLITSTEWLHSTSKNGTLIYISAEKFPLRKSDLQKALEQWPEFSELSQQLLDQYPIACEGFHTLSFAEGRIKLILMFGDAAECYSKLHAEVDAWYLDGFAPSKNPEMWSPELFEQIGRLSKPGTTFSTFTAAGIVRRGLQAVGFDVKKQKGFGRKREMLVGTFIEEKDLQPAKAPWFNLPKIPKPDSVVVVGGGLAGCSTAYALAKRGVKVTLIEKESELATAGSGNPQGALYAKLPVKPTKQGELHITGLLHTLNLLKREDPEQTFWKQSGVVQLATSEKEKQRQQSMIQGDYYPESLVTHKQKEQLEAFLGTETQHSGLLFPEAGWVSPKDLCQHLCTQENINIIHTELTALEFIDGCWQLHTQGNQALSATHIVICAAEHTKRFAQTTHLPLKTIRGQVSIINAPESTPLPKAVVCGEGYISPAKNSRLCFGATFDLNGKERNVSSEDHLENISNLTEILPKLGQKISADKDQLTGRTAFRCSTPDYMPIVGPAPVHEQFTETFAQLRKDRKWNFGDAQPEHFPNLYVNTGHGSKGLITCPISAELIASMLCSEPLPLPKELIDMINPCRFIIKNLIKQAI